MRETAIPGNGWLRERYADAALALVLGLCLAFLGPYRTYEQAFLARLGFWAGLLACWFVVASLVERALQSSPAYRRAGPWRRRVALVALTSLPMILAAGPAAHALTGWEASVLEVLELYLQTAVIGGIVVLLSSAITTPQGAQLSAPPAIAAPVPDADGRLPTFPPALAEPSSAGEESRAQSRLITRLPAPLRGRLLCLEMEDHYVRVHTDRGSALVLLRLGDAIAEASPFAGRQVHRSWWVANKAVERFERTGRTGRLILANGLSAPVSRSRLKAAAEMAVHSSQGD